MVVITGQFNKVTTSRSATLASARSTPDPETTSGRLALTSSSAAWRN